MTHLAPLQPGDRVALVAPSSPFARETYETVRAALEARGYSTAPGKHSGRAVGYLAGTDVERAEDLIHAITDPNVAAVFCIRGGYGSGRLLPWLPFSSLAPHRKIFVGHSDITFLHTAFTSLMGWTTFLGPNLVDAAAIEGGLDGLLRAFFSGAHFSWNIQQSQVLKDGTATGKLFGGNLTCFAHLIGTPFFPNLDGTLLLLEDRGEAPYRLDRMLTHLKLAGVIDRLGGLLLGQFSDCGDMELVTEMFLDILRPFSFPIVGGLPFGHTDQNEVIPLGACYSLNTYEGFVRIQQSPFHSES